MTAPATGPGFGLHHVQASIPAGSEDTRRAFYAGALGLVEVPGPAALAARLAAAGHRSWCGPLPHSVRSPCQERHSAA